LFVGVLSQVLKLSEELLEPSERSERLEELVLMEKPVSLSELDPSRPPPPPPSSLLLGSQSKDGADTDLSYLRLLDAFQMPKTPTLRITTSRESTDQGLELPTLEGRME